MKINLKRTNLYLTKEQLVKAKKISYASGLTCSELMRRALDVYLEKLDNKDGL